MRIAHYQKLICLTILFILYSFSAAACSASENHNYNVILITINALRPDHLKTYGCSVNNAPFLDDFSSNSIVFERAIAQSSWTLPSQISLFTSKYVNSHGVYERNQRLSNTELLLPEILKLYGYNTAAFVGGLDLAKEYGLSKGFDYYFDDTQDRTMNSFKDIVPRAISWLKENKNNRFFLFLQGYDVHPPYNKNFPPEDPFKSGYKGAFSQIIIDYKFLQNIHDGKISLNGKDVILTAEDIKYIIAQYDKALIYADKQIGNLLRAVSDFDLTDKTIIIITSEHGEELMDHGSFNRFGNQNIYDEVIHVPLFIKSPLKNLKHKRIKEQVQLIDIMPTILDLLDVPINKEAQGLSLVPLITGRDIKKDFNQYVYSEASPSKWTIRTKEWKLIYTGGQYELYDIQKDKLEKNNLVTQNPEIVYNLLQKLLQWRKRTKTFRSPNDTKLELTEDMKQKLKEAGYW
jgi:arylsulfatase A-like enzyme